MGLLDKAKSKLSLIAKGAGEESFGVVKKKEEKDFKPVIKPLSSEREDFIDAALFADVPEENEQEKLNDILEFLQIKSALEVPETVMLPDDLKNPKFDKVAPIGYDMGQVDGFISQARSSLAEVIKMHDERNKDIEKLAKHIDRVQTDNKKLMNQSEMAQGVSIMPTISVVEMELNDAQMTIVSLRNRIHQLEAITGGEQAEVSPSVISQYNDRISLLEREKEELEWQNEELKKRIMKLESDSSEDYGGDTTGLEVDDSQEYLKDGFFGKLPENKPQGQYNVQSEPTHLGLPEVQQYNYDLGQDSTNYPQQDNNDDSTSQIDLLNELIGE